MTSYILYGLCAFLLIISFIKDKGKTKIAIKKGLTSFENIMPQFFPIIIVIGIVLSLVDTDAISKIIGSSSGFLGVLFASIAGSITIMPTFIAFSMSNSLLQSGAGYAQVAALVSTLTMVGIMTFSLEAKYMGTKVTLLRNILAFLFSFVVAGFVGMVFSLWT